MTGAPTIETLYDVCEATWPPARRIDMGDAILRDGAGGGKRVSAATCDTVPARLAPLEERMRTLGQQPLFMIRDGQSALDMRLAQAGYTLVDPVNVYLAPLGDLMGEPIPPVTAFAVWPRLAIMEEIWATGGIGPERLAVMDRAEKKSGILTRLDDKPAGVAFAGISGDVAMVHAVEVLPHQRRKGAAAWMMRKAALWAAENGALWMAVLCTQENRSANRLYESLGFQSVGTYHYRLKEEA